MTDQYNELLDRLESLLEEAADLEKPIKYARVPYYQIHGPTTQPGAYEFVVEYVEREE
jgi:hypothetical protein